MILPPVDLDRDLDRAVRVLRRRCPCRCRPSGRSRRPPPRRPRRPAAAPPRSSRRPASSPAASGRRGGGVGVAGRRGRRRAVRRPARGGGHAQPDPDDQGGAGQGADGCCGTTSHRNSVGMGYGSELERVEVHLAVRHLELAQGGHGRVHQPGRAAQVDVAAVHVGHQAEQAVRGEQPARAGVVAGADDVADPGVAALGQVLQLGRGTPARRGGWPGRSRWCPAACPRAGPGSARCRCRRRSAAPGGGCGAGR